MIERLLPLALLGMLGTIAVSPTAHAQGRGTQLTRDTNRVLVNKDVGAERWAISLNEDGTATGNVFRSDGGPPSFVFCSPLAGANAFSCSGADACSSEGVQRGIQGTPDGRRILVNKDVGTERWAITLNSDGTALGNVFRSDGGPPSFLSCDPLPDANQFACYGADDCSTDRCVDQYAFIANIELPPSFFQPPTPCGSSYSFIANIVLPAGFFVPVRPTLEFFSLPSATIASGSTAQFEVSADASTDSLVLQFNSGQSRIRPDIVAFPSGVVLLDYVGHIDPQSHPPPYRVGFPPSPVSILPIPNSPVLPLELGTYQVLVGNVAPTAATVNGTVIRTRRSNLNVGRLDLRIFFVGIAGLDASTAANNPAAQAILDEFNRKLGAAGIQLGTVTLRDYPQDRATALTVVDLDRDGNGNGVADQMEEIFSLPRPMGQRTLDLFLVTDIIGASGLVIGFSGAIPGPALAPPSVQSGVVAAVLQSPGQPQDNAALAQTIVHETGHYLGLYHTTELVGGLGDPLVDTPLCTTIAVLPIELCPDASDLMFPQQVSFDQSALTSDQAFVLQRHPLIRDE